LNFIKNGIKVKTVTHGPFDSFFKFWITKEAGKYRFAALTITSIWFEYFNQALLQAGETVPARGRPKRSATFKRGREQPYAQANPSYSSATSISASYKDTL